MKDNTRRMIFAAGAALAALAAAPFPRFDLDRFLVPKELTLHLAALALALPALRGLRALEPDLTALLLAAWLGLGLLGGLAAPDYWLAARALALSASSAAVFLAARAAPEKDKGFIAGAACAGAALAAAAALAQAYGLESPLFSPNRAPGGTMGNRNFAAHLAAVFAPALVPLALAARSRASFRAAAAALAALCAALVLARSRTGLLAFGAGTAALAYGLWRARPALGTPGAGARLRLLCAAAAAGALAALLLPNELRWKSRSPYLDTVTGIANYRSGSGQGRLEQYGRSLRIALDNPVLGAGAGNWGLVYPGYVDGFDRSIDYVAGRTMNPWPSSDWIAALAERGLPALLALAAVFALLLRAAWLQLPESALPCRALALSAALPAAVVAGCFDVFQLLPAQAFLFWSLAGALSRPGAPLLRLPLPSRAARGLALSAAALLGAAALRSAGQLGAMALYTGGRTQARLAAAALLDPANAAVRNRLRALRGR